jgi:4-hydroxy-tetrahydrodipicolinate synthase
MPPATSPTAPSRRPFGAVLTAMVTPFTDDGGLDLEALQHLAVHLVDAGNDGLVVNGTTGEAPTLSDAEQDAALRAVLEAVGERAHVLTGVGTNDTAHSCHLAQVARRSGAHGVLVVTPYYSKPPQEGLLHHFRAVADAAGVPVMLYDIPGRTGTAIATDTLVRLAEHELIVAVKDAKGDLYEGSWVMARCGLAFYSGDDALNHAWLTSGGVGIVSVVSHVASPAYAAAVKALDAGHLDEALRLHRSLLPAVRGIMTRAQGAVMSKAGLQLQGVLASRAVRLPLVAATDAQVEVLRDDLAEAGLLRRAL